MSDSTQSTNHVSFWHRITGLRRHSSGNPTGTPPAVNPQSIATHDNIAQSKIEQGADLEQGSVHPVEDEGAQTEEIDQQSSPFTSSAFDRLPKPLPVEDIFFNECLASDWTHFNEFSNLPIPSSHGWNYKGIWDFNWIEGTMAEHLMAKILLSSERPAAVVWTWWLYYFLISDMADFKQNYMEAWRQRHKGSIRIYVSDQFLTIPIPHDVNDEALLRRLRMFYRMIKVEQGIPGLLLPRQLGRIDCVKISIDPLILLGRTETLQLGRYKGRLISLFRSPQLGKDSSVIANKIQSLPHETALEFKQTYNLHVISLVLAAPPVGSVIFAATWIPIFVHKQGVDLQNLIGSAFTVASYIVTTGALIIAFVTFFDQKKTQNEKMIDRIGRKDTLEQNGVPNNTMHNEDSLNLDASAPQASSAQNQPVAGTPNLNPSNPLGESAEQQFTRSRS
ncbi:hypothetical protein MMC29_008013 [Sticta canariensis]|nr:hypothetical protein [Sticta canariensis]